MGGRGRQNTKGSLEGGDAIDDRGMLGSRRCAIFLGTDIPLHRQVGHLILPTEDIDGPGSPNYEATRDLYFHRPMW